MTAPRVAVLVPCYNEEAGIPALGRELTAMMARNATFEFEVILVENGSQDASFRELMILHKSDPRFKIVQLSRNFLADGGVAAGLKFCTGDCAILMDADLQDPPEVVLELIATMLLVRFPEAPIDELSPTGRPSRPYRGGARRLWRLCARQR